MVYAMNMRGHWLWICVRFSFNNKKCVAGAEQTECQHQMRSGRRDVGVAAFFGKLSPEVATKCS